MSPAAKRDRLSALPDDVLHRILRHLDARQPVGGLSLLSRRWRRVWASSPYVTLSDAGSGHSERFGNLLLLFRDRAAALHTLCLESKHGKHVAHQRMWLRYALSHDLRVLKLTLRSCYPFELPESLFNCATLQELGHIVRWTQGGYCAPKSVHLPQLKKLHLSFAKFDPSAVEKLNSGCPTLEDMSLSKCCSLGLCKISFDIVKALPITDCKYSEIQVSAPNACSLRLTVSGKVQLDGMPFLVRAWVYFSDATGKHLAGVGYNLLAVLCNVPHLELFRFSRLLQCKNIMESSAIEGLLFSKLKSLYVGEWALHDFHQPFAYFLKRAPSLATLTLDQRELTEIETNDEFFVGKKPSDTPMLVSVLNRDLETLRIRVSEDIDDDIQEFNKMRKLLKEKTRPKETVIVWFKT